MNKNDAVLVVGHTGLVGSALVRCLQMHGYTQVMTAALPGIDLRNQAAVTSLFLQKRPDYVFLAAAKVGGILANKQSPASFIYDNLMIQTNVIDAAYCVGAKKLLFFGSSCIYPRDCPQPIKEEYLLTGPLEETNKAYALAKIAGVHMCQSYNQQYGTHFISCMPTNLYGPYDNFDPEQSHVLPALIRKFITAHEHKAPSVTVWGTGTPRREFLYVDDLAEAAVFLMQHYNGSNPINIGTGSDSTIAELAYIIAEIIGYDGDIHFDTSFPDGTPQKLLDVSLMNRIGWSAKVKLRDGIRRTIAWYKATQIFSDLKKPAKEIRHENI